MELSLLFIMVISYSGIFVGFLLGKIAPEERKPLKNAVHILQHLSVFFAFAISWIGAYFDDKSYHMVLFLVLMAINISIHTLTTPMLKKHKIALSSIALGLFLVFSTGIAFVLVACSIFAFFTCLGILETTSKYRSLMNLAIGTCWFLLTAIFMLL